MTTEPSFGKLLARLADARIRFVVVGGVAVALNGYVRLTDDVDILIDASPENIGRMLDALAGFGEGFARQLSVSDFADEEGAVRIVEQSESCQIDIFVRMRGLRYADIAADATAFVIDGRNILHASKSGLIRLKSPSTREKDILDVEALRRLERDPRAFD